MGPGITPGDRGLASQAGVGTAQADSWAMADPFTLLLKFLPERILEKLESTEHDEQGHGGSCHMRC